MAELVVLAGMIVLVGMMGAGKTTVGRLLARRRRLRFIDSDEEIVVMVAVVTLRRMSNA